MNRITKLLLTPSMMLQHCRGNVALLGSSMFRSPVTSVFVRGFAGEKKKGKKQAEAPAQTEPKSDSLIPINIYADGKDPEVLPDDQYPEWLWHMLDPIVTPDEWETRHYEGMNDKDLQSVIRVRAARRIKESNLSKAK